jgi:hypothetical protein
MHDLTTGCDERPGTLRRLLFRDSPTPLSAGQVVRWWESRRLAYNAIVGATGVMSLLLANLVGVLGPYGHVFGFPPLIAIGVVGALANICYTAGPLAELAFNGVMQRPNNVVGPAFFRYGTAFSVGITLLPLAAAKIDLAFRVIRWLFEAAY